VDELAELGDDRAVKLTLARCSDGSLDFSYSGLKSQAVLAIQRLGEAGIVTHLGELETNEIPPAVLDLLAGFRVAAVEQIIDRLTRLLRTRPIDLLAVSGCVAANRLLRRRLEEWAEEHGVDLRLVPLGYAGDNAAMIAHAALLRRGWGREDDPLTADAASRIPL
jgi:N6-L-threonylcarbamoyladenine synthase